jgi:anti-sigma regulatory factor (Ser/Thr protein kinase)
MPSARTGVSAQTANLGALQAFLASFWDDAGLPASGLFPFELALEEVFMNVVMHGQRADGPTGVDVSVTQEGALVTLVLRDDGPAFDPLGRATPDTDAAIEDRPIGGLGVHLVRTLMDAVAYRRDGEVNELSMTKSVE